MKYVSILASFDQFASAGLPSIAGVLCSDHQATPIDDEQWQLLTYVTTDAVIAQLQALGLTVEVLQDDAAVEAKLNRIAQNLGGGGTS